MNRSSQPSTDTTRERILDVAVDAFSHRGFSAVSTREIAGAAGVNVATLNYHFGSKQGVYDAAVARVYDRLRSAGAGVLPALVGASRREQVAAVVDISRRERAAVRLLMREVLDHGRMTPRTERDHFLPSIDAYAAVLGELLAIDAQTGRTLLVTAGFLVSRFAIQDTEALRVALDLADADAVRERVIDIVCDVVAALLGEPPHARATGRHEPTPNPTPHEAMS